MIKTATCELDIMGNHKGCQYGYGADSISGAVQISYNKSNRMYATNSIALFTATWANIRLLEVEGASESIRNVQSNHFYFILFFICVSPIISFLIYLNYQHLLKLVMGL